MQKAIFALFATAVCCLAQTAEIRGIVTGDSKPLAGAKLSLTDSKGKRTEMTADDTGQYKFNNLTAGTYKVSAAKDGWTQSDAQGAVNNESLKLDFALQKTCPVPQRSLAGFLCVFGL